jgi:hypothetical protein
MNPNLPPRPVLPPHSRHRLSRVSQRTRARRLNSVIESRVDVAADIAAINHGAAIRRGDTYEINGRIYGLEPGGRAYPIAGPGIHQLGRRAFQALGVYNSFGLTVRSEWILDRMQVSSDERESAQRAWRAEQEGGQ